MAQRTNTKIPSANEGALGIFISENDRGYIRTWRHNFELDGPLAPKIVKLVNAIDGKTSWEKLCDNSGIPVESRKEIFEFLADAKVIGFQSVPSVNTEINNNSTVQLITDVHGLTVESMLVKYVNAGSDPSDEPSEYIDQSGSQLTAVVLKQANYKVLNSLNKIHQEQKRPWFAIWWEGSGVTSSQVMIPGKTACFDCYRLRTRPNYLQPQIDLELESKLLSGEATLAGNVADAPLPELAIAAMNFLLRTRIDSMLLRTFNRVDKLAVVDLDKSDVSWQGILKDPLCPTCGVSPHNELLRAW
ncbi:bacteriocin biosynthesis cyclodehydratase domain-containing protein [Brevibacterium aurantiacum]|uniref:Bacteriocin biosynthesis cyclodehydratase domain-containing protein n=1 Tax=Brevibacterium aurantiacum TaxID=273384 RepID=A0A2H1K7H3_BREAU|nr:TOMM precursor leader peptide-binding protein [Brevibacterium aurantiacum]SMX95690.1 bacteriocin biosynthesis cyclodehydratase domain-containing protein [Brevibacterium aurantiacum]